MIEKFPQHRLIPNAHYWIGASQYRLGNYEDALHGYTTIINKFPKNHKAADAYFMKGKSLFKLARIDEGKKTLAQLEKLHPKTEAAGKARELLKSLGKSASD